MAVNTHGARDLTGFVQLLVREAVFDVVTESGSVIELWSMTSDGVVLQASARRTDVAAGTFLGTRLVVDGVPHRVVMAVDRVGEQEYGRMALDLRLIDVLADRSDRRGERTQLSHVGTITSLTCEQLPPGETIPVKISQLSTSGFSGTVPDVPFRIGDRLRLRCRVVEGIIDSEARVMRTDPARLGGLVVGCALLDTPPATEWVLRAALRRLSG